MELGWLMLTRLTGQTCQAAVGEVGGEAGEVRYRAPVERCRVCVGAVAAQERGYRQGGVGGVQDGAGGRLRGLREVVWRRLCLAISGLRSDGVFLDGWLHTWRRMEGIWEGSVVMLYSVTKQ